MKFGMLKNMIDLHVLVERKVRAMINGTLLEATGDGILVRTSNATVYVAMDEVAAVTARHRQTDSPPVEAHDDGRSRADNPMAAHDEPSPV